MTVDLDQLIGPDNGGPTMRQILDYPLPGAYTIHPDGTHYNGQDPPPAIDMTVWPWNETGT